MDCRPTITHPPTLPLNAVVEEVHRERHGNEADQEGGQEQPGAGQ